MRADRASELRSIWRSGSVVAWRFGARPAAGGAFPAAGTGAATYEKMWCSSSRGRRVRRSNGSGVLEGPAALRRDRPRVRFFESRSAGGGDSDGESARLPSAALAENKLKGKRAPALVEASARVRGVEVVPAEALVVGVGTVAFRVFELLVVRLPDARAVSAGNTEFWSSSSSSSLGVVTALLRLLRRGRPSPPSSSSFAATASATVLTVRARDDPATRSAAGRRVWRELEKLEVEPRVAGPDAVLVRSSGCCAPSRVLLVKRRVGAMACGVLCSVCRARAGAVERRRPMSPSGGMG